MIAVSHLWPPQGIPVRFKVSGGRILIGRTAQLCLRDEYNYSTTVCLETEEAKHPLDGILGMYQMSSVIEWEEIR